MLPAPGQGALAIQIKNDRPDLKEVFVFLDDAETRQAVTAERAVLKHLGGGCAIPLAAYATSINGWLSVRALIIHPEGTKYLLEAEEGPMEQAEAIGARLARRLLERGAETVLQQVMNHG